jgi:tetratricopeptide (TPR) repeat protein
LRIFENKFGVDHINTVPKLDNLGTTYSRQGKYDEAIAYYERSLRIKERAFGVDHINTAPTINNLGITYYSQRKYDKRLHIINVR